MTLPAAVTLTHATVENAGVFGVPVGGDPAIMRGDSRLSDIQSTALDLYKRGLNVFPVPTAHEWRATGTDESGHYKKPPYILKPFFTARLHVCIEGCKHSPIPAFTALFVRANIGAMTGRTSGNLLAIDCDSQAGFERMGKELTRRGLPFWAYTSHRGGTYLLRLAEGECANLAEGKVNGWQSVQIWGNRHYIVVPPSIHPAGEMYAWMTPEPRYTLPEGASLPAVPVDSLEWLGVTLQRGEWKEPDLFGLSVEFASLSYKNRVTLANGANEGARNSKLAAAAYDLAGCEIDYQTAERAIMAAADNCNPPYPVKDARSILKSAYKKTGVTPARENRHQTGGAWELAASFANSYDWAGRYGRKATARKLIFLACVKRAELDRREVFRATEREIAEISGRDRARVRDWVKELCADKFIVYAGSDDNGANLYRFGETCELSPLYPPCSYSGDNSHYQKTTLPGTDSEKNVFSKHLTAWHVWRYLLANPTGTRHAIAKQTGLPRKSVYEAIKWLVTWRLVSHSPAEGLFFGEPATDNTLSLIAADMHTNGKAERKRELHRIERETRINKILARVRERAATITAAPQESPTAPQRSNNGKE